MALQASSYQQDLAAIQDSLSHLLGDRPTSAHSTPQAQAPVDIRTFIKDSSFCGDTGFWEKPLQELEQILAPGCKGAVIEKGIRGSKSYTTCYIPVYLTYRLMFEEVVLGRDPRLKYDLDPVATVIYNAIFTINGKLAKRLFYYISNFVERCAWFKRPDVTAKLRLNPHVTSELQWCPVDAKGKPQWDRPRYAIYPGHSKLTSAAGVALFTYILDECNLFPIATSAGSSGKDYVEELDEECDMRVTSSFGQDGQRIYISRRNVIEDFTSRKKAKWEALETSERYFTPPPKTSWDGWPQARNKREKWRLFEPVKYNWVKGLDGQPLPAATYHEMQLSDLRGLWVPERFWDNFTTDPESALKVLASIPAEAQEPFIRRRDKILPDFEMENPVLPGVDPADWMKPGLRFDHLVADWFYGDPEERYHFHCDLALRWDKCGLVIARSSGIDEVALAAGETRAEKCALVDIEAFICIGAPKGGEIEFAQVRRILYWLRDERGFKFRVSSFDGWQSEDSRQILEKKGFVVEVLSMDKTMEPYTTLKDGLYEGRCFFPPAHGQTPETTYRQLQQMARDGDPSALFQVELRSLEVVNGKKIDHPPKGSKDISDAACGAFVQASRMMRPGRDH